MKITIYHFQPLDIDVRSNFELPAWPYTDDPDHMELFNDYLKSLTVLRYQDTILKIGNENVNYPINYEVTNDLPNPFMAFRSTLAVDDETFKIKPWPPSVKREPLYPVLKEDAVMGDLLAWFEWNLPVEVSHWDEQNIKFRRMEEFIQSHEQNTKCHKDVAHMTPEERRVL